MKHLLKILVSLTCSFLILGLLFGIASSTGNAASPALVADAVRGALPLFVGVYILCQFGQTLFRALRARLLLKASLPKDQPVPGILRRSRPFSFSLGLPRSDAAFCVRKTGSVNSSAHSSRGCLLPAWKEFPP